MNKGVHRFLGRTWRLIVGTPLHHAAFRDGTVVADEEPTTEQLRALHKCIAKLTDEIEGTRFNTGISAMMEFITAAYKRRPPVDTGKGRLNIKLQKQHNCIPDEHYVPTLFADIDHIYYESESRTEWCRVNSTFVPCFLFTRKFSRGAAMRLLNGVSPDVFSHVFGKVPPTVCLLLWCLAVLTQVSPSFVYVLRCTFTFSWLRRSPCTVAELTILLDIKIYGQWFTTEKRFLLVMANPTSQISVIGNLVTARAAAEMGWKESTVCPNSLPVILRPTFFLFFAAPSMASFAWNSISGAFDNTSKMFFFSLFLFISLGCRPFLFQKSMRKFNVAWWAYSFPLTFIALAAVQYAQEVKSHVATLLMLVLSVMSLLAWLNDAHCCQRRSAIAQHDDPMLCFSITLKSAARVPK
ncbi:Detected protein of unknown function [Hibiscus syriacus]|uniref:Uncharacterized protein n=1 Tax=Hibiscus syriacus TaxID=106335 RepID=A0A6A3BE34_HIBSY|nr:Detected protein of unknown function [Hibiscus syriacus]